MPTTFTDPLIQESVVRERLVSGLEVAVVPRPGLNRTFATFATHYGSIDSHFRVPGSGEELKVPDGIAHFLEHKMFEKPDGDAFARFAALGASANAYTEYTTTTYLFSTTAHVKECLDILLGLVQDPYFTPDNVAKEKGIIEQEIRMYLDMPGDRLHSNLMRALYQKHPARLDIAGSVESIRTITPDVLYRCYETFYHPDNMLVLVVGNVDPAAIIGQVAEDQARRGRTPQGEIGRIMPHEPLAVEEEWVSQTMPVNLPLIALGFKDVLGTLNGRALLRQELVSGLMWGMLVGKSAPLFSRLYEEGLVNDRFSARYQAAPTFAHSTLGGETPDPSRLVDVLQEELPRAPLTTDALERLKKREIGEYMTLFNSPEDLAYAFNSLYFRGVSVLDFVDVLEGIRLEDIEERRARHIAEGAYAVSVITPGAGTPA
jgi:predicted Zn-dependent peptidase